MSHKPLSVSGIQKSLSLPGLVGECLDTPLMLPIPRQLNYDYKILIKR